MNIYRTDLFLTSGKIARERARLAVASDRLDCGGEELLQMKNEIVNILEKYMIVTECVSEVRLNIVYDVSRGKQDVKTIQIK